jgi:hypothetical protein
VGSLTTYSTSIVRGAGWAILALAAVGFVAFLWKNRLRARTLAPWLLLAVPFGFYVLSLYTGQAVIRLEQTATDSMFNLRYGVEMLAGLAVFAGLGLAVVAPRVRGSALRAAVVGGALVLVAFQAAAWWPNAKSVPVVEEGLGQRAAGAGQYAAAEWLRDNARDGGVLLIDDSVNPVLPVIDVNFDRVAAPFSGPRWTRTLHDLARAEWLYVDTMNPDDDVARAVERDPNFHEEFERVFADRGAEVYQRRAASTGANR